MTGNEHNRNAIGKAFLTDYAGLVSSWAGFTDWVLSTFAPKHAWSKQKTHDGSFLTDVLTSNGLHGGGASSFSREATIKSLNKLEAALQSVGISLAEYAFEVLLRYEEDGEEVLVVNAGKKNYCVPGKHFRTELYKDYTDVETAALLEDAGISKGLCLISTEAGSLAGMNAQARANDDEITRLQEDMRSVKTGTHPDIAELQAKLDKMKADLMQRLESEMEEMEKKKEYLERQIFLLDSQIYAIRCFSGEAIQFRALRHGTAAAVDKPIVLQQKVRYLDEELGQLVSIYDVDCERYMAIEQLLSVNDIAFERFCPADKCVAIMRVSKTGTIIDAHSSFQNMLDHYDLLHGKRIGILIRNGEQLYVGWTEESRINIREDMFLTPGEKIVEEKESKDNWYISEHAKRRDENRKAWEAARDMVSRAFLFAVVDGVLDRGDMLQIPEKASVTSGSKYLVFSAADNWIEDKTYPAFAESLRRSNERTAQGDNILTMLSLYPQRYTDYGTWKRNDRGRGYANRTHDVSVENATIYPINLVELGDEFKDIEYQTTWCDPKDDARPIVYKTRIWKKENGEYEELRLVDDAKILSEAPGQEKRYFVSLEKRWSDNARANFEVFPREFMNLTYMNSCWLRHAIMTKNLGGWEVEGTLIDYSYAIRYLNIALEYVTRREETEAKLIAEHLTDKTLNDIPDWPAHLSEWKLDKGVRTITPYQAKRFAVHLGIHKEA